MGTRRLLWVRMHNVQEWLGKNISDLVRKDIYVFFFETKSHTNDQIRKYKRSGEKLFSVDVFTYVCSGLMSRIIKNCRGEKKDDFRSKDLDYMI